MLWLLSRVLENNFFAGQLQGWQSLPARR
ncbi:hypothetical protein ACNKHT_05040 [Shigella flexneri]